MFICYGGKEKNVHSADDPAEGFAAFHPRMMMYPWGSTCKTIKVVLIFTRSNRRCGLVTTPPWNNQQLPGRWFGPWLAMCWSRPNVLCLTVVSAFLTGLMSFVVTDWQYSLIQKHSIGCMNTTQKRQGTESEGWTLTPQWQAPQHTPSRPVL